MPRDGSQVYSKPSGTTAVSGATIESAKFNSVIDDIVSDLNLDRPIEAGGTAASTASAARTNLGLAIGTDVQAFSADLTALDAGGANTVPFYAAYGGTADAITLTSGRSISAYATGQSGWFKATAQNTGPMTANLDGLGARVCKTITGADTPSGYVRTDVLTHWWNDGTNIILDRQIERGSGSGEWVKWADGTMVCTLTTTYNATAANAYDNFNFPATFTAVHSVSGAAGVAGAASEFKSQFSANTYCALNGTTGWSWFHYQNASGSAATELVLHANGLWY